MFHGAWMLHVAASAARLLFYGRLISFQAERHRPSDGKRFPRLEFPNVISDWGLTSEPSKDTNKLVKKIGREVLCWVNSISCTGMGRRFSESRWIHLLTFLFSSALLLLEHHKLKLILSRGTKGAYSTWYFLLSWMWKRSRCVAQSCEWLGCQSTPFCTQHSACLSVPPSLPRALSGLPPPPSRPCSRPCTLYIKC